MQFAFSIQRELGFADVLIALRTVKTMTTRANQRYQDMISRRDIQHVGPDGINHAGCLVAIDSRQCAAPTTVHVKDVAVADCTGGELDMHLILSGRVELKIFDDKRLSELAADGSFHGGLQDTRPPIYRFCCAMHQQTDGLGRKSQGMISRQHAKDFDFSGTALQLVQADRYRCD